MRWAATGGSPERNPAVYSLIPPVFHSWVCPMLSVIGLRQVDLFRDLCSMVFETGIEKVPAESNRNADELNTVTNTELESDLQQEISVEKSL